jgi:hypothetical protein
MAEIGIASDGAVNFTCSPHSLKERLKGFPPVCAFMATGRCPTLATPSGDPRDPGFRRPVAVSLAGDVGLRCLHSAEAVVPPKQ